MLLFVGHQYKLEVSNKALTTTTALLTIERLAHYVQEALEANSALEEIASVQKAQLLQGALRAECCETSLLLRVISLCTPFLK